MKLAVLALVCAVCPAWAQIAQSHPEYCGIPGDVNPRVPPEVSAIIDQSDGHAVVYVRQGSSTREIPLMIGTLPSLISEISQVCPLSDGRLVIFGEFGGTDVFIIDTAKASLVDSFPTYFPVMSPDQRWIVYRKFYPTHGVEASDELLIYDLTKTPAQNRPGGNSNSPTDVGRLLFPPGQSDIPFDNIGVPREQMHFIGRRLYWAADGRALLFKDQVEGRADAVVLATLDNQAKWAVFEHRVSVGEMCGGDVPDADLNWRIDRAEVGADRLGGRLITVDLGHRSDRRCLPHLVQLYKNDFQPVKPEVHVAKEPSHGMIREGHPPVPPKKKK